MYKCKKKDCYYRVGVVGSGSSPTQSVCGYCLLTGELRGCPADKCDKYTSRLFKKRDDVTDFSFSRRRKSKKKKG